MTNRHNEIGQEEAALRKELAQLEPRVETLKGMLHALALERRKLKGLPMVGDIVRSKRRGDIAKVSKVYIESWQSMKGFRKKKDGTFSQREVWLWDYDDWKVVQDES